MSAAGSVRTRALDAAMELLSEKGADALTLRGIARRAGIGAASIYHHFDGRSALLVALALAGFSAMKRDIVAARDAVPRRDSLEAGSQTFFDFAAARPALFSLMFDSRLLLRHAPLREAEQDIFALFHDLVRRSKRIPARFKMNTAMALWAPGRGVAAMHAAHPSGALPAEDLQRIFRGADYLIDRSEIPLYATPKP